MAFKTSSRSKVTASSAVYSTSGGSMVITGYIVASDSTFNTLLDDTAVVSNGYLLIKGSNFTAITAAYLNGVDITANCKVIDANNIQLTMPTISNGTYTLMLFNSTNSGAIYSAIKVSGFPTWTSSSSYVGVSAVNLQLSATGDAPLTYYVQSGSSLPSGLTLTSSGLLSGTVASGVYSVVLLVDDAQAQTSQLSFTLTIASIDPYFYETTLLLNGEANTASYIADASTNNLALTVNGSVAPNRFNPLLGGYYGVSFDGSTGYLSIANSTATNAAMNFSTNSFTIECWLYLTSYGGANYAPIFANQYMFYVGNAGQVLYYNGSSNVVTGNSGDVQLNVWTHLACVRNGTTVTIYVNGVSKATATVSASISYGSSFAAVIGNNSTVYLQGYISNLRVVNGTAVYTSAFTPSTIPLTAIPNTVFLTCQSNQYTDSSPYNWSLIPSGTVKVVPNHPFGSLPSNYTANTSYSAWFDGGTGYLTAGSASNWTFLNSGTSNYMIEAWVFPTSNSLTSPYIMSTDVTSYGIGASLGINTSNAGDVFFAIFNGAGAVQWTTTAGGYVPANTWSHIALTYTPGGTQATSNVLIYVNGNVRATSQTVNGTYNTFNNSAPSNTLFIGAGQGVSGHNPTPTGFFQGYISNERIVNGSVIYTGNFTVPTSPLSITQNASSNILAVTGTQTTLLTLQGSPLTDASANAFTITPTGNVKVVNNAYPFTSSSTTVTNIPTFGSGYFDGSTGYLTAPASGNFAQGVFFALGATFTVEAWLWQNSYVSASGY